MEETTLPSVVLPTLTAKNRSNSFRPTFTRLQLHILGFCILIRFVRGSVSYYFGRRWYRISSTARIRIRVKGRFRRVKRVRRNISVLYRGKTSPIRFIYGKIQFYYKRMWRRISTIRGRRARRRQRQRNVRRYWRRFRRRRRRRRRRYGKRNGRIFFRLGRKFYLVRSKKGRLSFRVGTKYYFLR